MSYPEDLTEQEIKDILAENAYNDAQAEEGYARLIKEEKIRAMAEIIFGRPVDIVNINDLVELVKHVHGAQGDEFKGEKPPSETILGAMVASVIRDCPVEMSHFHPMELMMLFGYLISEFYKVYPDYVDRVLDDIPESIKREKPYVIVNQFMQEALRVIHSPIFYHKGGYLRDDETTNRDEGWYFLTPVDRVAVGPYDEWAIAEKEMFEYGKHY